MTTHADDWPRVRAVFEHALTLPASARPSYVATTCRGRDDIRHEVERMLASHDRADDFLQTAAAVAVAGFSSTPRAQMEREER